MYICMNTHFEGFHIAWYTSTVPRAVFVVKIDVRNTLFGSLRPQEEGREVDIKVEFLLQSVHGVLKASLGNPAPWADDIADHQDMDRRLRDYRLRDRRLWIRLQGFGWEVDSIVSGLWLHGSICDLWLNSKFSISAMWLNGSVYVRLLQGGVATRCHTVRHVGPDCNRILLMVVET